MTTPYAKTLITILGLALLFGCNEPPAATTDGTPVTQSGSNPKAVVPIDIEVDDPTPSNALTAAAAITPANTKPGETVTFAVRAKTADRWHIYAFEDAGVGVPTKLTLELPDDVELDGEWVAPEALLYASVEPCMVFEGDLMFQHTLKIADGAAPGPREVKCIVNYQTCNDAMCNAPTSIELTAMVEVE